MIALLKKTARPFLLTLMVGACGASGDDLAERGGAFDRVWQHVSENFYDEKFHGKDWKALGEKYRPLALAAPTDEEFYRELNTMLFELEVSHIGVIPDDHPEWIGAPSAFANGEVGLEIRVIENQIVIVRRNLKMEDAAPDLQPGTIITALNGLSFNDFLDEVREPPSPMLPELMQVTERASRALYAEPGKAVHIAYLDKAGNPKDVEVVAYKRGSAITLLEGVPPVYVDFESRVLDGNIGYIRFNSFHMVLLDQIVAAIEDHDNRLGLIIDLRGNVGGDFNVRRAIAERLIQQRATVWRYNGRRGLDNIVLEPADNTYNGKVIFLVDELSASSAEELPGAMQALGRATVVGNQTAGLVLVADVLRLDIGASLIFPVAETSFVNGYVPEGKGIVPDVKVSWDRQKLLQGIDPQLDAALALIR